MTTTIAALDETTMPMLAALMPQVWGFERDAGFVREMFEWRYLKRPPGSFTWLAVDRGRCVGLIDSYLRPYLLDGRRILVRETADWFCLPEYRPLGIGLRLMRRMMGMPEPLMNVGGSEATRSLLPRLGWRHMAAATEMVLPVTLRGVGSYLLRRNRRAWLAKAIPNVPVRRRPRERVPCGGDALVEEWAPGQSVPVVIGREEGLVEVVEPADLGWISAAPCSLFRAVVLLFRLDDEAVGLSVSQFEPAAYGIDGRIVHLQLETSSPALADWVVRETTRRLIAGAAGFIRCRASCPSLIAALRRAGFLTAGTRPVYWYSQQAAPDDARPISVTYLRADDAVPFEAAKTFNLPPARPARRLARLKKLSIHAK